MRFSVSIQLRSILFYLCFTLSIDAQVFGDRQDLGLIQYNSINEASGIVASRKNLEVLWTHNDSGDSNRIFAFSRQGVHLGVYRISGATNRDWEDIAVGPGPVTGKQYIYIGDIGDNNAAYNLKYIYRVVEPDVSSTQNSIDTTLLSFEKITFQYPDGRRDAETLMVDPLTKDIYIVSKREDSVRVYLLAYPQSTTQTITATHMATLNLSFTVGGDIASSGYEILIKTRSKMYYWFRSPGQNLWEAFNSPPLELPYIEEPQGEAVGWAPDVRGYYTISEEADNIPAHLYFYPRIDNPFFFKVISLNVLIEGFYNGTFCISDTVTVELRNSTSPFPMIAQTKIVIDNAGHSIGNFLAAENFTPYFLVIKHRNAIETWSAAAMQFTLGALSYDFTTSQNKAFGGNQIKKGNKWCIYSGDVNQDELVNISDLIIIDNNAFNYSSGYLAADLNGDNTVDLNDLILCDNNFYNSVSTIKP